MKVHKSDRNEEFNCSPFEVTQLISQILRNSDNNWSDIIGDVHNGLLIFDICPSKCSPIRGLHLKGYHVNTKERCLIIGLLSEMAYVIYRPHSHS